MQLTAALPPIGYAPYDPTNPAAPYNPVTSVPPPSAVALLIGKGAAIDADPGAVIGLTVAGHQAFNSDANGDNSQVGDIAAQTGVADIEGSITAHGGAITIALANQIPRSGSVRKACSMRRVSPSPMRVRPFSAPARFFLAGR